MATQGKVLQVLGPVVDVEFPPGDLPEIYTALLLSNGSISDQPDNLTIEFCTAADIYIDANAELP